MLMHIEQTHTANQDEPSSPVTLLPRKRCSLMLVTIAVVLSLVTAISIAQDGKAPEPGTNEYYVLLAKNITQMAESYNLKTPYCSPEEKAFDIRFLEGQLDRVNNLRSEFSKQDRVWQAAKDYTRDARAVLRRKLAAANRAKVEDCTDGGSSTPPETTGTMVTAGEDYTPRPAPRIIDAFVPTVPSKLCSKLEKNSLIQLTEEALKTARDNFSKARSYEDSLEGMKNGQKKRRLKSAAIEQTTKQRKISEKLERNLRTIKAMDIEKCTDEETAQRLVLYQYRLGIFPLDLDLGEDADSPRTGSTGDRSSGPDSRSRRNDRPDSGYEEYGQDERRQRYRSDVDYGEPTDKLQMRARYRDTSNTGHEQGSEGSEPEPGTGAQQDKTESSTEPANDDLVNPVSVDSVPSSDSDSGSTSHDIPNTGTNLFGTSSRNNNRGQDTGEDNTRSGDSPGSVQPSYQNYSTVSSPGHDYVPSSGAESPGQTGGELPDGNSSELRIADPQVPAPRTDTGQSSNRTGTVLSAGPTEYHDDGSAVTSGTHTAQGEEEYMVNGPAEVARRTDLLRETGEATESDTATMAGSGVMRTFTDSAGDGWDYCSGKCNMVTQTKRRADGTSDKVIRVSRGSCDADCSCVLFNNSGPKLVNKLEVTDDDETGYLNIGPRGKSADYTVRCCE